MEVRANGSAKQERQSLPLRHHPTGHSVLQHGLCAYASKSLTCRSRMTEENHCYENSTAERVNGILKDEFYLDNTFHDYLQALKAVRSSVEIYNNKRPHWL